MKLLLLHGPASNNSRAKLTSVKNQYQPSNVMIFESSSDTQVILGSLMTGSLLGEDQLFILENPSEDFVNYPMLPESCSLVLWFDHDVSGKKPIIDWVKKSKGEIIQFAENREVIFPFLDYLAAKDKKAYLELQKSDFDVHYITTMVYYLLRNLAATPKNAHPYVAQKLAVQRKNFTKNRLISLYKEIFSLDFRLKSGLLEENQAKFLLVEKFLN